MELGEGEGGGVTALGLGHHRHRLGGGGRPAIDAGRGEVQGPVGEPGGPLRTATQIDHPGVGVLEGDSEVIHHRIPEPLRLGDRARVEVGIGGDAVAAHELGRAGGRRPVGIGPPHDRVGHLRFLHLDDPQRVSPGAMPWVPVTRSTLRT